MYVIKSGHRMKWIGIEHTYIRNSCQVGVSEILNIARYFGKTDSKVIGMLTYHYN